MFSKIGGLGWALGVFCAGVFLLNAGSTAGVRVELLATGVSRPVFVTSPPGDTNRLFVIEQHTGRIRIFNLNTRTFNSTTFMIQNAIATGDEQGLLGLAFHPKYASNGYFYVNMTSSSGGRTQIIRYTATGDPLTADTADRATGKIILSYAQPAANHNGGWLGFGPDGYLYISSGDGGLGNDPWGPIGNGQNRSVLLGKILRLDVDGGDPYAIPEGNPFRGHATFAPEIWAFGLRNPWRCSFDRESGNLWIGDVGQNTQEEIDVIPAGVGGLNFGWRPYEGTVRTPAILATEQPVTPHIPPVTTYGRSLGVSVTGGYVYRGTEVPELRGKYIFADYGSARFWTTTVNATGTNGTTVEITNEINPNRNQVTSISSFGEDERGELYICALSTGRIFRIVSDTPKIGARKLDEDSFVLTFTAFSGTGYTVETKSPLVGGGGWTTLTNIPAATSTQAMSLTNSVTGSEQYFRVRAQ
jgi:glucose/arabinose dehydrogenase